MNLHDEIKQKVKIFNQLKSAHGDPPQKELRSASLSKRKREGELVGKIRKKGSFDGTKSPKSSISLSKHQNLSHIVAGCFKNKKPTIFSKSISSLFKNQIKKKKVDNSLVSSYEDDVRNVISGYFSGNHVSSFSNTLNKSKGGI